MYFNFLSKKLYVGTAMTAMVIASTMSATAQNKQTIKHVERNARQAERNTDPAVQYRIAENGEERHRRRNEADDRHKHGSLIRNHARQHRVLRAVQHLYDLCFVNDLKNEHDKADDTGRNENAKDNAHHLIHVAVVIAGKGNTEDHGKNNAQHLRKAHHNKTDDAEHLHDGEAGRFCRRNTRAFRRYVRDPVRGSH